MYCPNCKQEYDGKFCPECGTRLIEKPAKGFGVNFGDANAISGGVHLADSHNVHNEDRSIHNISNTTSTVNNITQVAAQKTEIEILQEKKTLYLNECKRAYEDNVLEQSEVIALEECRIKLGLDKSTANTILESVRVMSERNARKTELNPIAKTKLKILTSNLQKNEVKALMDQIDSLEPLVRRFDHDELSRKYYLVLSALKPEKCIEQKERTKTDTYWEAFWCYLAYIKAGRLIDAEETLASLDHFSSYPEDNMTVLAAAGALMRGSKREAKEYLDAAMGDYTPALQRFVDSIYLLLDPRTAKEMGANENTCAFYLVNFFGEKDPKAKAEEERIRKAKAEEEAERKKQFEEEKKRKAEEKAKREAEAKKKAEAERKRREEEEQRNNSSAYSVILLEDPEDEVELALYESNYFDYPDDFLRIQIIHKYVDSMPCELFSGLKLSEAESIKSDLEGAEAKVKICLTSEVKEAERVTLDMEHLKKLAKADEEYTNNLEEEAKRRNNEINEAKKKATEAEDAKRRAEEEARRKAEEAEEAKRKAAFKTYNGHDCVDLGLPSGTLWATCNIGASKPEESGNYFSWGETTGYDEGKREFDDEHYKFITTKKNMFSLLVGYKWIYTKYCDNKDDGNVDNKSNLDKEDDAAHVQWGKGWRIPTKEDFNELRNEEYTECSSSTINGIKGLLITSKINGCSVFIPVGGEYGLYDANRKYEKDELHYWLRTLGKENHLAYSFNYSPDYSDSPLLIDVRREFGMPIRPVHSKE